MCQMKVERELVTLRVLILMVHITSVWLFYFVMLSLLLFVYFVDYVVGGNVEEEQFILKAIIVGYKGNNHGSSKNDYDDAANYEANTAKAASLPP